MEEKNQELRAIEQPEYNQVKRSISDGAVFLGVLGVTFLALAAVALVTPLILVLSAFFGLFQREHTKKHWHPATI